MIRFRAFLLVLLILCGMVLVGSRAPAVLREADQGPVYSVAAVLDHLERGPHAWIGRTLLVRGRIIPCTPIEISSGAPCPMLVPGTPVLSDASSSPRTMTDALMLTQGSSDPLLAQARRLPLLGDLLPAPQVLIWGVVGIYRVQLRPMADSNCGAGECYEAVLLDAAGGTPPEG